jgi:hypothetical protein
MVFKIKFKDSILIGKFFSNINRVSEILSNELSKITVNLDKIICFVRKNEISVEKFEKDRKLHIFINSSLVFRTFAKRITYIMKFLKFYPEYSNYTAEFNSEALEKHIHELGNLFDLLNEKFNFKNMTESHLIDKFHSEFKELKVDKVCLICLHGLDVDINTNVFSYDFHIQCINFWLNLVDNISPFI